MAKFVATGLSLAQQEAGPLTEAVEKVGACLLSLATASPFLAGFFFHPQCMILPPSTDSSLCISGQLYDSEGFAACVRSKLFDCTRLHDRVLWEVSFALAESSEAKSQASSVDFMINKATLEKLGPKKNKKTKKVAVVSLQASAIDGSDNGGNDDEFGELDAMFGDLQAPEKKTEEVFIGDEVFAKFAEELEQVGSGMAPMVERLTSALCKLPLSASPRGMAARAALSKRILESQGASGAAAAFVGNIMKSLRKLFLKVPKLILKVRAELSEEATRLLGKGDESLKSKEMHEDVKHPFSNMLSTRLKLLEQQSKQLEKLRTVLKDLLGETGKKD